MNLTTVAIVDDQPALSAALQRKLDFAQAATVLFCADSGREALDKLHYAKTRPQIIFMDIEMPGMDGVEATWKIKSAFPDVIVIMLTVFDDEVRIFNAIRAGATGYLLKDEPLDKVLQAMQEAMDGGAPMSPGIAAKTLKMLASGYTPQPQERFTAAKDYSSLSTRESEVLELLASGLRNQQIAEKLFISAATVKRHVESIYQKLQLHSRVELVRWYQEG